MRISFRIHLHSRRTGAIDVVTAVITANKGEHAMTSIAEETETAQAQAAGEQPKGSKKTNVGKRARNVAPKKAKSGKIRVRTMPRKIACAHLSASSASKSHASFAATAKWSMVISDSKRRAS